MSGNQGEAYVALEKIFKKQKFCCLAQSLV
jgi:hypothetical protein